MKKSQFESLIREVIRETIRKVDGKYVVYPEKGGKRLGTHSSKAAAEKQLTAIHLNKEAVEIKYTNPNFDAEWQEAVRYPEFNNMGKESWIRTARVGQPVSYSSIKDVLGNVDLNFEDLQEPKKQRFQAAFLKGIIEMPIAVKFSDDDYDLVAGNTRLSGLVKNGIDPKIWIVDLSEMQENYADGKVTESKQIGNLYHYTSAEGLKSILTSNSLKASVEEYLGNELHFVSFTRNKNFHNKGQKFNVKTDYRITLDGDKLSNKYKIKPFAYIPGWNYSDNWEYDWLDDEPESVRRDFFNATGDYDEQEERISFKNSNGSIPNIKNYILKVDKVSDLQENYADGKVKGKSRPGRVKKSGASCKGSVTDLRAKAKKYGGEKGKMYHWCANMKGGKKK